VCKSRLKWQCRRGMLELDHLLTNWLAGDYELSSGDEKSTFRELLQLPDEELAAYLLGSETPDDNRFKGLVDKICRGADT
jgi:antitoxin CptB